MDTVAITLNVNGQDRSLEVSPSTMLLDVLREDLHLTGTKNGCGQGHCGACTVIVDGKPIRSCITKASRLDGAHVETIEGLARGGSLHPVQAAFIAAGAIQCGFCTPGMVMSVKALLDASPNPTRSEMDKALEPNLCRCTGYGSIIRAVRRASASPPDDAWETSLASGETHTVGHSCQRPDAREKVTGAAIYAADLRFPGMLHAKVLRSQHAHARVLRVETSRARSLPGVAAVLTADDIPGARKNGHVRRDWPILVGQGETVRYLGDALALVAAESEATARQALALIAVDYQPLPGVFSAQGALAPGAPLLHSDVPGNLLKHIRVRKGNMVDGWARATEVVEAEFTTPFIEHAFLEPEAGVAVPDGDGITVYVGSQIPFDDRRVVAETLALPLDRVRIIATAVGGAFGGKEDVSVQPLVALLAKRTGRPVKLVFTRQESMLVHPKRHPTTIRIRLGASADGKLTAVEATIWGDSGAYASLGDHVMTRTATHLAGPYVAPNVQVDCYAAYTNNPPAGAMRGFGVPQAAFAMESAMDMLARRLGLHPLDLRRRNALQVGSVTACGQLLTESVGLLETIDRVHAEVQRLGDDILTPSTPEYLRAWGYACCMKNVGMGGGARDAAGARVVAGLDGQVEVRIGAAEVGQGLVTVAAQIAAEELRVPYETISVIVGDTGKTPDGGATTASRQTFVTGNAVRRAARQVRQLLDAGAGDSPVSAFAEYVAPETVKLGRDGDKHFAYGFATQAALIEVNKVSGLVKVLKVIAAHDVGRALNPEAVRGQVEGGVTMGVGFALTERLELDHGVTRNADLRRYRLPRIDSAPEVTCILVEAPASEGPFGAKGVGEITSIPTAPAITNAIFAATGLRITDLPAILPTPLPDGP
jgi:selenium-dependent xanthine dehydrogenase